MFKKTLSALLFSSLTLMALETGETIPKDIQTQLNMEEDKVYVLNFFASWCKACKKELALVNKVHNEKITNIIGINVDKKKEEGEAFVQELELQFPVIYDEEKALVETFSPIGFPAVYYVKNNKVLHTIFGAVDNIDEQIASDIKEIK
ncbi:MAG: Thioredoxin family protein [uncultured Sulfurovum sp.]|uniref:Thioredoxin family protein n=1 Tax=uncultured Sulfurovum sp. TaxID=269237 RepID=A0A6S6T4S0_9BACT|nr:MAG: Thioredoxin family protein [uncultured Sulfurovum sp.]